MKVFAVHFLEQLHNFTENKDFQRSVTYKSIPGYINCGYRRRTLFPPVLLWMTEQGLLLAVKLWQSPSPPILLLLFISSPTIFFKCKQLTRPHDMFTGKSSLVLRQLLLSYGAKLIALVPCQAWWMCHFSDQNTSNRYNPDKVSTFKFCWI